MSIGRFVSNKTAKALGLAVLGAACLWVGSFSQSWPVLPLQDSDFPARSEAKEALGKLLFFDKVLSGNRNMSCATCHHPFTATGDRLSLPVGEGGAGLGLGRTTGVGAEAIFERVPRNSPGLFNLGATAVTVMFHDGRVMVDPSQPSGFATPAGDRLPQGLEGVLAAQAMFPVTSAAEMAGQLGENTIADAAGDLPAIWAQLADRLRGIEGYTGLFQAAFPDIKTPQDITYVHAANAIGAFEAGNFRCTDAPLDRYLRGEADALGPAAEVGMALFYGKAGCVNCHAGPLQTDQMFHAIGMPQIGPGKGDGFDGHEDFGRERVTGAAEDRYRFRTPSLRQVTLTGPWGHDGAFRELEAVVRHHLNPADSLERYDLAQPVLPQRPDLDAVDFIVQRDPARRHTLAQAIELQPVTLTDPEVAQVLAFLGALTDTQCLDYESLVPASVPSGLPVCSDGCFPPGQMGVQLQAVAHAVANDPMGHDADHYVGDQEIVQAVQAWVVGKPMPGFTERLSDAVIVSLVLFWVSVTTVP